MSDNEYELLIDTWFFSTI